MPSLQKLSNYFHTVCKIRNFLDFRFLFPLVVVTFNLSLLNLKFKRNKGNEDITVIT